MPTHGKALSRSWQRVRSRDPQLTPHQHVTLSQTGRGGDTNPLCRSDIHTLYTYTSSLYVLLPSAIVAIRPVFAVLKNRSTSTVKNGENFILLSGHIFHHCRFPRSSLFIGRSSQCRQHVQLTCDLRVSIDGNAIRVLCGFWLCLDLSSSDTSWSFTYCIH